MINFLKVNKDVSVGPCFIDVNSNLPIHKLNNNNKISQFIKNLVLGFPNNDKIMGKVSKSGTNFGVDFAYYEDLIHSKILIKKNIRLFIIKDAICKTDFPIFPKKFKEFIRYIKAYSYNSKIYNVGIIRKYICMTLYFLRYIKNL